MEGFQRADERPETSGWISCGLRSEGLESARMWRTRSQARDQSCQPWRIYRRQSRAFVINQLVAPASSRYMHARYILHEHETRD